MHAVRQITERFEAASALWRQFLGASSCVRFPSFTDETDKAASMQAKAVAARQLLTVIGRVAPGVLHSGSSTRAGDGPAADDGGDDDDDGGGSSKRAKEKKRKAKKLRKLQQANSHDGEAVSDSDDDDNAPTSSKKPKHAADPAALEFGGSCT